MKQDDLGPMPEPTAHEPELVPGGTDAVEENQVDEPLGRDLMPEDNPVDGEIPDKIADEISEPDDKSQAPDSEAEDETGTAPGPDVNESAEEPPAGQEAEDGSVEPPA